MSKVPNLFYAGGDVLANYGAPSLRTSRAEDVAEQFTRASSASYIAADGSTLWASSGVLRTEWVNGSPTLKLSTADSLYWDIGFAPQARSVYVKFDQLQAITAADGIFQIGSTSNAADPRLSVWSNGGAYRAQYDDATTSVTAISTSAPAQNDTVELLAVLSTAGSLTLHQSINSATATTATASSTALTIASTWAAFKLWYNSLGATIPNKTRLHSLKVHSGTRTLAYMRALA